MKKELLFSLSLAATLAASSSYAADWVDTSNLPPEAPPEELFPPVASQPKPSEELFPSAAAATPVEAPPEQFVAPAPPAPVAPAPAPVIAAPVVPAPAPAPTPVAATPAPVSVAAAPAPAAVVSKPAPAPQPAPAPAPVDVQPAPVSAPDEVIKTVTPVVSTWHAPKATAIVLHNAALRSRPTNRGTGDIIAAETRVRMESNVVNSEGNWWFVTATGIGGGWLLESELGDPQN